MDTAKVADRSRAASALGRAFRQRSLTGPDGHAAEMAMTFLLDDPSPKVRLSLAEAIADSADTPRSLILPLAADQPEIAYTVIFRSPVLTDDDLVEWRRAARRSFAASSPRGGRFRRRFGRHRGDWRARGNAHPSRQ